MLTCSEVTYCLGTTQLSPVRMWPIDQVLHDAQLFKDGLLIRYYTMLTCSAVACNRSDTIHSAHLFERGASAAQLQLHHVLAVVVQEAALQQVAEPDERLTAVPGRV